MNDDVSKSRQTIAQLIAQYQIRPNRLRGQNFLVDDSAYEATIAEADIQPDDHVLEVGPGLGTLTERIGERAKKVTAIEVDQKLVSILSHRFKGQKNIEIIGGDIMSAPVAKFGVHAPYRVVSNIPYYLTGSFFRKFLSDDVRPTSMTVLIQKEVAERMVAKPGHMSLLSLSVQLYGLPHVVRVVSRKSFHPIPNVDSAILHVANIHEFPFRDVEEKFFWRVSRSGFSSPRKQLKNTIHAGFRDIPMADLERMFREARISPTARAQELSIEQWHFLSQSLSRASIKE